MGVMGGVSYGQSFRWEDRTLVSGVGDAMSG